MKTANRIALGAGFAFVVCLMVPAFLYADAGTMTVPAESVIRQTRVEGADSIAADVILGKIQSRAGTPLDQELLAADSRAILAMPEIYQVSWRLLRQEDNQVDVVFVVSQTPLIRSVTFQGNGGIETEDLLEELRFAADQRVDRYLINQGLESLRQLYKDKGYYFAQVSLDEQALDDLEVVYVIVEGPRLTIDDIMFEGNVTYGSFKLKSKVSSKERFPIFVSGYLDDEKVSQDVQSLAGYYHDQGFLDARVFVRKNFSVDRSEVDLTFVIEEGPRYVVGTIAFEGNTLGLDIVTETLKLESGDVLSEKRRTFAVRAVQRAYGKRGYVDVAVNLEPRYSETEGVVDVVFHINEGRAFSLGQVVIRGNYQTRDKVIRRDFDHYGFLPGTIFNTDAANRAQRRLEGWGYFEKVSVTPFGDAPASRDALVEVTETRTGLMMFGVGVDTDSGVVGSFSIEQRNFDINKPPKSLSELFTGDAYVGGGQRLRLSVEPGTEVTRGSISFHEPYLYDLPYYLDLNAYLFRRWRECYLERRFGGSIGLGHRFDNDWALEGGLRAEMIRISDLDTDKIGGVKVVTAPQDVKDVEGSNTLTTVRLGVKYDSTDSAFHPTEGYKVNMGWEQAVGIGGDFEYASLTSGLTAYHTIYEDITERKTVLAGHVEGGKILNGAPTFERYYAGGLSSMRGFRYRGVSPRAGRG